MAQPTSQPITNAPTQSPTNTSHPRATNEYKEDFANAMRGKVAVHNVLSTTPDHEGGYLVPVEF